GASRAAPGRDAPPRPRERHALHRLADGGELRPGLPARHRRNQGAPVRRLLALGVVFLPWKIKRWVLRRHWGYQIADGARIGLSYVFPGHLVMEEGAYIGHLNVAIHLGRMECGAHSIIDRSNWITGHPPGGAHFRQRTQRDPSLVLGAHSAITKSHI